MLLFIKVCEYMLFKDINLFWVMSRCINPEEIAGGTLHVHCCVHMTILVSFVDTRSMAVLLSTGYLCNKCSKKRVLWIFTFFRLYKTRRLVLVGSSLPRQWMALSECNSSV